MTHEIMFSGNSFFGDWECVRKYLLVNFNGPEELSEAVSLLSQIFISRNSSLTTYADDPRLAAAYAAFYLPGHWSKWDFLWSKLPTEVKEAVLANNLIDWGAGPGTFSLRWALESSQDTSALAIEQGQGMQKQGVLLASALNVHHKINWSPQLKIEEITKGSKDYSWIFGHSLNEGHIYVLKAAMKVNRPLVVMAIEPVSIESWQKVLQLREWLMAHDYSQVYPCPQAGGGCPAAHEVVPCHQVVRTQLPFWLEQTGQLAMINRRDLAMVAQVWASNKIKTDDYPQGRVVHSFAPLKYGFRYQVCLREKSDKNQFLIAEELKRGLTRHEIDQRLAITAGDGINWSNEKGQKIKITQIN